MDSTNVVFFRNKELRYDNTTRSYSGECIVFNSRSLPIEIGGKRVYEVIKREFLQDTDFSDVVATFNHDYSKILARSSSGTLGIEIGETAVKYSYTVPDTTYGNDLIESTNRGDIRGSSFGFLVNMDDYEFEVINEDEVLAYPTKIRKILDLGPVTHPAYPATSAQTRSFVQAAENFFQRSSDDNKEPKVDNSHVFKRLEILKHPAK